MPPIEDAGLFCTTARIALLLDALLSKGPLFVPVGLFVGIVEVSRKPWALELYDEWRFFKWPVRVSGA